MDHSPMTSAQANLNKKDSWHAASKNDTWWQELETPYVEGQDRETDGNGPHSPSKEEGKDDIWDWRWGHWRRG